MASIIVGLNNQAKSAMKTAKTTRSGHFVKGILAATLVGLVTFTCMPANAAHEMIYGVDQNNNLINFFSDTPGTIINTYSINGIKNAEEVRGIDFWQGTIYAFGSFGELYTLNPNNGVATQVGSGFGVTPNGASFGVDNGPAGFELVSGSGQNLLVNRNTGVATVQPTLAYATGDPNFGVRPRVDGLAYDAAAAKFYAFDTLANILDSFDPATGLLHTIGANGIDTSRFNGADNSDGTGIMYLGSPAASSDPQSNLYTVNKTTGAVTLVGQIDYPTANTLVQGLTVVVPEPGSIALLGLGAFGLLVARRRQQ
jgi:hypothetical protein